MVIGRLDINTLSFRYWRRNILRLDWEKFDWEQRPDGTWYRPQLVWWFALGPFLFCWWRKEKK